MIDEAIRKKIEAYIPSPRDLSLRPWCDYYVNQNGRVRLGHVRDTYIQTTARIYSGWSTTAGGRFTDCGSSTVSGGASFTTTRPTAGIRRTARSMTGKRFARCRKERKMTPEIETLTAEERYILILFRRLTPERQQGVLTLVRELASDEKGRKQCLNE